MNCIAGSHQLPLLPSQLKPKRRQQNLPSQLPSLHSVHQIYISQQRQRFASLKGMAIPSSLVLVATPPAKAGDVSVLLQTSGVLLIAYLIANFIVPELIMKSYKSDEIEKQKSDEKEASMEDEGTDASEGDNQARSFGRKKQGYSGNKR